MSRVPISRDRSDAAALFECRSAVWESDMRGSLDGGSLPVRCRANRINMSESNDETLCNSTQGTPGIIPCRCPVESDPARRTGQPQVKGVYASCQRDATVSQRRPTRQPALRYRRVPAAADRDCRRGRTQRAQRHRRRCNRPTSARHVGMAYGQTTATGGTALFTSAPTPVIRRDPSHSRDWDSRGSGRVSVHVASAVLKTEALLDVPVSSRRWASGAFSACRFLRLR
jgi:hypothetical protein